MPGQERTLRPMVWRLHQSYALDRLLLEPSRIDDPAMELSRLTPPRRPGR